MGAHGLHTIDCPNVVQLVNDVCDRATPPKGYTKTDFGCTVDWEALESSYLSSTELYTLRLARVLYDLQTAGGAPPRYREQIRWATQDALGDPEGVRWEAQAEPDNTVKVWAPKVGGYTKTKPFPNKDLAAAFVAHVNGEKRG